MQDYLPAWRALPKLFTAATFVLEVLLLVLGRRETVAQLKLLGHLLTAHFAGAALLVALVLLTFLVAGVGSFLLELGKALLSGPVQLLCRALSRRWRALSLLASLGSEPFAIAL